MATPVTIPSSVAARAATNYTPDSNGCWNSNYAVSSPGYPKVGWQEGEIRRAVTTSRAAWTHHSGRQVPEGGRVKAKCRNRLCVNPEHIFMVERPANWKPRKINPHNPDLPRHIKDPVKRFWAYVDKSGDCWQWNGGRSTCGYGRCRWDDKSQYAHRIAYQLAKGPIPEGMYLDHKCFNTLCVNPAHLRIADTYQNAQYHQGANRDNKTTGVRGVHPHGRGYSAIIGYNNGYLYLGTFDTVEEADAAAQAKREELYDFYKPAA